MLYELQGRLVYMWWSGKDWRESRHGLYLGICLESLKKTMLVS